MNSLSPCSSIALNWPSMTIRIFQRKLIFLSRTLENPDSISHQTNIRLFQAKSDGSIKLLKGCSFLQAQWGIYVSRNSTFHGNNFCIALYQAFSSRSSARLLSIRVHFTASKYAITSVKIVRFQKKLYSLTALELGFTRMRHTRLYSNPLQSYLYVP